MSLSFLKGPPVFEVILKRQDIGRILSGVADAANREGRQLIERLGQVAVDLLQGLEAGMGRQWLGPQWKKGPTRKIGDAYYLEVYNAAEGASIPNTNWRGQRRRGYKHSITGQNLLKILEYGARAHTITGSSFVSPLVFLAPRGGVRSRFLRISDSPAKGIQALKYRDEAKDKIVVAQVNHPGVKGDHFLRDTQRMIEERLAGEIALVQRNISTHLK